MREFVPYKQEKEVISIRISSDLLKTVDKAADKSHISRNEFINQCISYALDNLAHCDGNEQHDEKEGFAK